MQNSPERAVNSLIVLAFVFYLLSVIGYKLSHFWLLDWLSGGFGAALVGAVADSYAVYGLFYRLGPHTDLLRKNRTVLTERVLEFVERVIFDERFLREELKRLSLETKLGELAKDEKLKERLKEVLSRGVEERLIRVPSEELPLLKNFLGDFSRKVISNLVDRVADRLLTDDELRRRLAENLEETLYAAFVNSKPKLLEFVERKLNSISDEEFLEAVKRASWRELQFIRLNGAVLGFVIGLALKGFEILLLGTL